LASMACGLVVVVVLSFFTSLSRGAWWSYKQREICNCTSLPDPRKKRKEIQTHTPGRYIYWLGVGWLAIPGNLTIPFFFLLHQLQNDVYK
jgi:hypothetical protein